MGSIFRDFFGVFTIFEDVYARIRRILVPPKAYSWQTLLYLSVFSWGLSSIADGGTRQLIAICGWLFLIAGTAWYTTDDPIRVPGTFMPLGAVITGGLVSIFAFGHSEDVITPNTIVLWPTIAALITAIPEFFEGSGTDVQTQLPKPEIRQRVVVLVACSMVLSCWINFYFVMDNWLREYPSLLADNFRSSTFIVRTESPRVTSPKNPPKNARNNAPKNGVLILNELQPKIEAEIKAKPWAEVERWLEDANTKIGNLGDRVIKKNLSKFDEKDLWRVETRISTPNPQKKDEYQLDILNIWDGPSSSPQKYYLKKTCLISPIAAGGSAKTSGTSTKNTGNTVIVAEIDCGSVSDPIFELPPAR
jgi:Family of unknown function (DUF5357)